MKNIQLFRFFNDLYNITKAYSLIKSGLIMYDIREVNTFEVKHRSFNPAYSDSLNCIDFESAQGLMIKLKNGNDLLIDGYHRMNKAYSIGRQTIKVYYITNPKTINRFLKT